MSGPITISRLAAIFDGSVLSEWEINPNVTGEPIYSCVLGLDIGIIGMCTALVTLKHAAKYVKK